MANKFKEVNKTLGENVNSTASLKFTSWNNTINYFNVNRAKFCKALQEDGYSTFTVGNYITATREGETNTFFFTYHKKGLTNYLIPVTLANKVQYFAFYDETKDCIYMVGYGKVREYTSTLTTAYRFGNSEEKLFVPDSWAKEQHINTYNL